MKRRLVIKALADLDVAGHYVFLLARNPQVAARFRSEVKAAYKRIRKGPKSFARLDLPTLDDRELRFAHPDGLASYSILFQIADDAVFVLRVLHASQDIELALRPQR